MEFRTAIPRNAGGLEDEKEPSSNSFAKMRVFILIFVGVVLPNTVVSIVQKLGYRIHSYGGSTTFFWGGGYLQIGNIPEARLIGGVFPGGEAKNSGRRVDWAGEDSVASERCDTPEEIEVPALLWCAAALEAGRQGYFCCSLASAAVTI